MFYAGVFGIVQVRPHHAHAFAVAPIEFAGALLQLQLFGRKRAARRNNGLYDLTIEIGSQNGAVVACGFPMLVQ